MGYRSDVAIKCEEKAYELFKAAYIESEFIPDQVFKEDGLYTIYWSWVKWYEDYNEVTAIKHIMNELDEKHEGGETGDGFGYRFLRLGEDDTDIEYRENDYDIELYMHRSIELPEDRNEISRV